MSIKDKIEEHNKAMVYGKQLMKYEYQQKLKAQGGNQVDSLEDKAFEEWLEKLISFSKKRKIGF